MRGVAGVGKEAWSVAVLGATELVGRELLAVLGERAFPVASLRALAPTSAAGEELEWGDTATAVVPFEEAGDLEGEDLVFLASDSDLALAAAERARRQGALVVDLVGAWRQDPAVAAVVPEANAGLLSADPAARVFRCPDPVAIAVAVGLAPLRELASLRRIVVTSLEPVSGAGQAGLTELETQTIDRFAGREPEPKAFPQPIPFNVLPQVGRFAEDGRTEAEADTRASLRALLGEELSVSVTRVRVPVFYGTCVSVSTELAKPVTAAEARDRLRASPGLLVLDDPSEELYPTPASVVGQDATLVGRIRADPAGATLDFWMAVDEVRKGAAVNAVQIAEILFRLRRE